MYAIREFGNPVTRELIDLAAEYGLAPEFTRDAHARGGGGRCARFRFASRAEMFRFRGFLIERGFQATLRMEDDGERYRLVCCAAVAA